MHPTIHILPLVCLAHLTGCPDEADPPGTTTSEIVLSSTEIPTSGNEVSSSDASTSSTTTDAITDATSSDESSTGGLCGFGEDFGYDCTKMCPSQTCRTDATCSTGHVCGHSQCMIPCESPGDCPGSKSKCIDPQNALGFTVCTDGDGVPGQGCNQP